MNELKFTGLVIKFNNTDIGEVYWNWWYKTTNELQVYLILTMKYWIDERIEAIC